jgi:uncharacterized protein (TIGR00725 family)
MPYAAALEAMRMQRYVGVVGPGDASVDEVAWAQEVGALLADAGVIVVCGGRGGVMRAACEGAVRNSGMTLGLLPGNDRSEGNPYLTMSVPTGMGELRNGLVVRASDGLVAVGGGWGTLSEISLARKAGKPVVSLGGWQVGSADGEEPLLWRAESPEQAVRLILDAIPAASAE